MENSDWLTKHPEIDNVRAVVCDLNGTLRGKRIPADKLSKVLNGEMRMPLSVACVDIWGEDIEGSALVFETGDADGICEYTGRGILPVTWTDKPTALVPLWLTEESGEPFNGDPRRALDLIVQQFKDMGLTPVVATELEFYLTDPTKKCSAATGVSYYRKAPRFRWGAFA